MEAGAVQDIDGLPLHVYRQDGEASVKPCAEGLLNEQAAERILEKGIMPLVSFKDRDVVRLLRFQSLADPPAGLEAHWG
jgi:type VI secretion system protein ImpC